jgi:hypothetical protein
MKLEELNKMFNDFGKYMVSQSKNNLKDLGKGGGPLENSITYDVDDKQKGKVIFEFLMQDYGEFQDKGVKGADPNNLSPNAKLTGQQAPNSPYKYGSGSSKGKWKDFVRSISAWAQMKNIRLRQYKMVDGKSVATGKFAKGNYESIGYVIASNIYNRGLKPSFFYTKPFNKAFENLPDDLFESFAVDIEHGLIEQTTKK